MASPPSSSLHRPTNSLLSKGMSDIAAGGSGGNKPASIASPSTLSSSPTRSSPLAARSHGGPHHMRSSSIPPSLRNRTSLTGSPRSPNPDFMFRVARSDQLQGDGATSLDLIDALQRSEASVVKTRSGTVLSRGMILKTDHYPSGRALDLELNVHGAPNFRSSRQGELNVFGAAQPRTQGLRAILSILRARPNIANPAHVVWFSTREEPIVYISGRPFVLRDASEPRVNVALSDRAENLEAIETRLKNDILAESMKYGGVVLTHNEVAADQGDGAILPTWTAVDISNVKTSRELWESMKKAGWNVDYYRIPISPDRPIEDNYLDAYLQVIRETDPMKTALVFCCGMGAVRTTFAMVAAELVRRKQIIEKGGPDPYGLPLASASGRGTGTPAGLSSSPGSPTPNGMESRIMQSLEQANAQQELSTSLLRLTYLLQQCLQDKNSQSAIQLLMSQPTLLENLRKAYVGNFGVILSLLGCLEHGLHAKRLVDRVIDSNNQVTNLREDILHYRLKYSLASVDQPQEENLLSKAGKALEKYFFMIAFASYVEESDVHFPKTFGTWLKARTEIWTQITFLRKQHGSRFNVFAPVSDLSSLSKSGSASRSLLPGRKNDVAIAGGQILGDEYSDHVVKNRSGIILRESMLLKSDQWHSQSQHLEHEVRGALNFRQIPGTSIYALGQPTFEAIHEVVSRIRSSHPTASKIVWITLREEPVVYINGAPYCLRRENYSLRNMKDYGGISAARLEMLEERLKDDVVAELNSFGGRLLLHAETADGSVVPIWEEVRDEDVSDLKDVMASVSQRHEGDISVQYSRIPITAERPPDYTDLKDLIEVVLSTPPGTPIVVNCQLGRGRSTLASIILVLLKQWIEQAATPAAPMKRSMSMSAVVPEKGPRRYSYQVINNLLRVIRKGPAVKQSVDDAVDLCSAVINIRDAIENARVRAEEATDDKQKKIHTSKALQNLRRYFELMVFQSYLQSTEPDTLAEYENENVETFVKNRPVIKTFEKELLDGGINTLKPLGRTKELAGAADPDEVTRIVVNRFGNILSASTIIKSDFFSNLQKMTLPERIDGSPNFRRVPMTLKPVSSRGTSPEEVAYDFRVQDGGRMVCGSGMPTVEGLKRALERVDAGPGGSNRVYWTSLREEPVIYVAGRPHVLRNENRPLENVEATGVTTAVVEGMEASFKKDVLRELKLGNGRILLHDEVEERPGVFSIIPIWEDVEEEDIMTPRDVFDSVAKQGYQIDYGRVAITDEQAPLPDALAQLLSRIRTGISESHAGDFVFNCQMGRGRTTTGMITACLISSTIDWVKNGQHIEDIGLSEGTEDEGHGSANLDAYDSMDGPSDDEVYLAGEYKTILQLVSVLSHGKVAKRLTDRAIDVMQDVQNLRKAIYDYKLKVDACEKGSSKERKLRTITVNYLYRYGTLIVFANYLIEMREQIGSVEVTFPEWLRERREITKLLERRSLE